MTQEMTQEMAQEMTLSTSCTFCECIVIMTEVGKKAFKFVDLCSGIGGFHLACVRSGGVCIQACDIDEGAREIYKMNYGIEPQHDVTKLALPHVRPDLVCFGNPCQPFSTIGQRSGLADKRGGRVFYAICKYLRDTKAGAFVMENVKGLAMHSDFEKMLRALEKLGYRLNLHLLNSQDFGSPQHRERVFVVGCKGDTSFDFAPLERRVESKRVRTATPVLHSVLEPIDEVDHDLFTQRFRGFKIRGHPPHPTKSGFRIRAAFNTYTEKRLFSSDGAIGTILSTHAPYIYDERLDTERHLSIKELLRCQGFPVRMKWPEHMRGSRRKALKYIGNAVHVDVVTALVKEMQKQHII